MLENNGLIWIVVIAVLILIKQFREKEYKSKRWWLLPIIMLYASFQVIAADLVLRPWDVVWLAIATLVGIGIGWYGGNKAIIRYDKERDTVFTSGSMISVLVFALGILAKFALKGVGTYTHLAAAETVASVAILFSTGVMLGRRYCLHRRVAELKNKDEKAYDI